MHGTVIWQETCNSILIVAGLYSNLSLHVSCFTSSLERNCYCRHVCIQMCLLFTQSPIPELQATANIHLTQCSTTGKHLQISMANLGDKSKSKIFCSTSNP